jgi:hypothetical protein
LTVGAAGDHPLIEVYELYPAFTVKEQRVELKEPLTKYRRG